MRLSDEYVITTEMTGTTLPVISFKSDGVTVNSVNGYVTELDPLLVRDTFVSLEGDNVISVMIDERGTDVRKLLYEIYDTETGEMIEDGQISAFDITDTSKNARLKVGFTSVQGREYAVELTFITSESKRVYYYFRFKQYDEAFFSEKVNYMLAFSEACRKKNVEVVIPYLESTYRGEGTDHSHVDIKDSYFMVCWGNLEPTLVSDITVTINEIYKYIAVGTLKYTVSLDTPSGTEKYIISERFRISMGSDYTYLLNYDRNMEAVFDPALISLSKSQLKFGITGDTETDMAWTSDDSMLAFVKNNTVYYYNLPENTMFTVYSMNTGYETPSDVCSEHDIKILRMADNGDVTFLVSGYINCGEYEGKTGMVLYTYYRSENRIKELLYVPASLTNQQIRQKLGNFSYMNSQDVFYFMVYGNICSYNLTTGEYRVITSEKVEGEAVFCRDLAYVAWQEQGDRKNINMMYLETGELKKLSVSETEEITLFGYIGDKIIAGYGDISDHAAYSDGSVYYPNSVLRIVGANGEVLKEYHEPGMYITGVTATDTAIKLKRVSKVAGSDNVYTDAPDDYILIYEHENKKSFYVDTRVTDNMLTEYYLSLPQSFKAGKAPKEQKTEVTVINENTLVRIAEDKQKEYEVYSYGLVTGITDDPSDAVRLADDSTNPGVVISKGKVFFEQGVKTYTSQLSKEVTENALAKTDDEILGMLNLNHATLSEMFYYIYKDIPVYSITDDGTYILITGYTRNQVSYITLSGRKEYTVSITSLSEKCEKGGNVFRVDR